MAERLSGGAREELREAVGLLLEQLRGPLLAERDGLWIDWDQVVTRVAAVLALRVETVIAREVGRAVAAELKKLVGHSAN